MLLFVCDAWNRGGLLATQGPAKGKAESVLSDVSGRWDICGHLKDWDIIIEHQIFCVKVYNPATITTNSGTFLSLSRDTNTYHQSLSILPFSQLLVTTNLPRSLWICLFWTFHGNRIIQDVVCGDCLLSLVCVSTLFFSMGKQYSAVWTSAILFIHLWVDGPLGCSHSSAPMNNAAVNIGVQVLWGSMSLNLLGVHIRWFLYFLRSR